MLFIIKPLSFPTSLLTELLKTAIVYMNTLIDTVSVISHRYSPIIYKFAFSNYIGKGSAQILDSTLFRSHPRTRKVHKYASLPQAKYAAFLIRVMENNSE